MIERFNDITPDWRLYVRPFWPGLLPDAPFSALVSFLNLDNHAIAAICDTTERTVRRWSDNPPAYVPLLLLARCGFLLAGDFAGWRVASGGLVHPAANSTKYKPINAIQLSDFACALQLGRSASVTLRDLARENDKLRARLHKSEVLARLPANVRLFPGVKPESVVNY